jgi:putative transposase
LYLLAKAGKQNSKNKNYQFWRQDNHPIELDPQTDRFGERLNYLHHNPVEAGIVNETKDYIYSSAVDYQEGKVLIEIYFQ